MRTTISARITNHSRRSAALEVSSSRPDHGASSTNRMPTSV